MKKVSTKKPFLCCINFFDSPLLPTETNFPDFQENVCFQEEARFTDKVTGITLFGLLQGIMGVRRVIHLKFVELQGLKFFPLEWMGNPTEMDHLKATLDDIKSGKIQNDNFDQRFNWATKKQQKTHWNHVRLFLENCFISR